MWAKIEHPKNKKKALDFTKNLNLCLLKNTTNKVKRPDQGLGKNFGIHVHGKQLRSSIYKVPLKLSKNIKRPIEKHCGKKD
jgi:hypothetical protein